MSDNIIAKIQKLMALADRAGTPEEAANAFEKAQKLMVKHAIDEAALRPEDREQVVTKYVDLRARDEIRRAKVRLLNHLGDANRVQVLSGREYVILVGFKSDVEFVEILFASVMIQYAGERTRAWKQYDGHQSRHIWVNAFAWAYAGRVGERLAESARRDEADAEQSAPGSALVLRDRKADVDDYLAEQFPNVKTKSVRVRGDLHANGAGRSAANRADLSGGRNNVRGGAGKAIG